MQEPLEHVPPVVMSNDALKGDIPDPTPDLLDRLDHWKHSVTLLEDYVSTMMAVQKNTSNGLDKVRKVIQEPPRFDYADSPVTSRVTSGTAEVPGHAMTAGAGGNAPGSAAGKGAGGAAGPTGIVGIAEAFNTLRTKTEFLQNKSVNTEQQLKSAILPQLETLKGDIEKHYKGLKGPGMKGMREVDRAKQQTQKHIEALAQGASSFGVEKAGGSKADSRADPYLKHRLVLNSVHDQVNKENIQADAVLSMQRNFQTLETHIVQVLQQAMSVLEQIMRGWGEAQSEAFGAIAAYFNHIPKDHEWNQYVRRKGDILVPEGMPKRKPENITFPNMSHQSVLPVIEGQLQRKGTMLKSYHTGYYVLTKAGYLHEFKSKDYVQDPEPEKSLYIPGCIVGPTSPRDSGKFKFTVQGKDVSKTITKKHNFEFRTNTYDEMVAWHAALSKVAGLSPDSLLQGGGDNEPAMATAPAAATAVGDVAATSPTSATMGSQFGSTTTSPVAQQPAQFATSQVPAYTEPMPVSPVSPSAEPPSAAAAGNQYV